MQVLYLITPFYFPGYKGFCKDLWRFKLGGDTHTSKDFNHSFAPHTGLFFCDFKWKWNTEMWPLWTIEVAFVARQPTKSAKSVVNADVPNCDYMYVTTHLQIRGSSKAVSLKLLLMTAATMTEITCSMNTMCLQILYVSVCVWLYKSPCCDMWYDVLCSYAWKLALTDQRAQELRVGVQVCACLRTPSHLCISRFWLLPINKLI